MNKLFTLAFCALLFTSCNNSKENQNKVLPKSSGKINHLSVVIDNDLWSESIGNAIRDSIGEAVYGLPQDEPGFSMRQMPTSVFTDFARKNRTVLKIEKGKNKTAETKFFDNPFAKPQKMVVISGATNHDIIEQIYSNKDKIISTFKKAEIKERQRRTKISPFKTDKIEEQLGITIEFPSAYRIAKEDDNFFWIRRDIKTGTVNLMLYEIPLNASSNNEKLIDDIVAMRDSVSKKHIPGPTEDTYMVTDKAYAPFFGKTSIDNKPTYETKSTWIVKGAFMSGPFINYAIEDKINNRYIIAEGFVFAPSVAKREFVFELESIIKSIAIK